MQNQVSQQVQKQVQKSEQQRVSYSKCLMSNINNNDGFPPAGGKKLRPKPKSVIGTSTDSNSASFKTVERRFHYCISGLHPDTSSDEVKTYVRDKVGANVQEVELIENRFKKYTIHKMFRVTVPASDESKMTDATKWLQNLSVRRFRMVPAPRQPIKLNSAAATSDGINQTAQ